MLVAGARPNFMKIAPLIRACGERNEYSFVLVHTGQHYDEGMSDVFFSDLRIPEPHYHLGVGSGSHAEQTARIMRAFEPICDDEKPECVIVVGDVNSTLACAIVAKKLDLRVAHVEAGLRSGDRSMPEEINRIVTDSITDFFFVTEVSGVENLKREGHDPKHVFFVGHVMVDNLFHELAHLKNGVAVGRGILDLRDSLSDFGAVTLHRPSNVDDDTTLRGIVGALNEIAERLELVFPVHPRTRKNLGRFGIELSDRIDAIEPLGYRDFLYLWRDARVVLTDSGGLQEETTALGIPCLTLRNNTERPITVTEGTNKLVGSDPETIVAEADRVLRSATGGGEAKRPQLWDGKAAERILAQLDGCL